MTTSDLSPRERRQQRTHRAILEAARAILVQEGADALSIRAIADRIDYSPAGLYEYFSSKDEIMAAVALEGHLRLKAYMQKVPIDLPISSYLVEMGMAYINFAVQNSDYFQLMFQSVAIEDCMDDDEKRPNVYAYGDMLSENSSFPILLNAIERGIAEGAIQTRPDFDQMSIAYAQWAFVHGLAMLRITYLRNLPLPYERIERHALERFVAGLQAT